LSIHFQIMMPRFQPHPIHYLCSLCHVILM